MLCAPCFALEGAVLAPPTKHRRIFAQEHEGEAEKKEVLNSVKLYSEGS